MSSAALLTFGIAYLIALAMPGPGVMALIARVLAYGTRGSPAFIAGTVAGGLLWFAIAAAGLAVLASTFAGIFLAIRYTGAAYLLYLAWKLWIAPVRPVETIIEASPDDGARLFLAGLAVNLGNPKNVMFFLALLPTVVDLDTLTLLGFTKLAVVIVAIASSVLTAYAMAAGRARRLFSSPRAVRRMNRGSAAVLAGAAATIATR